MHATFALDRFQENCTYIITYFCFKFSNVAIFHIIKATGQRFITNLVLSLTSCSYGQQSASVERMYRSNDAKFIRSFQLAVFTSQFQSTFVSFCATVSKEDSVEATYFCDSADCFRLNFSIVQIGAMHYFCSLVSNSFYQYRMAVT